MKMEGKVSNRKPKSLGENAIITVFEKIADFSPRGHSAKIKSIKNRLLRKCKKGRVAVDFLVKKLRKMSIFAKVTLSDKILTLKRGKDKVLVLSFQN